MSPPPQPDRAPEPASDPALMIAQLDERLRSMRNALALLGLVAAASLAIALLAMLDADQAARAIDEHRQEQVSGQRQTP